MPFLDDNEYLLLMDIAIPHSPDYTEHDALPYQRHKQISEDDLKRLYDVGVKTVLPFQCLWDEIEPVKGEYCWRYFDEYIERAYRVGMKVILFTVTHSYPRWMPDSFFVKVTSGNISRAALSPWNPDAMYENNHFTQKIMERYSSNTCLVANSQLCVGETVLLNEPAFYDSLAIESFKKYAGADKMPDRNDPETNEWLKKSYINMLLDQQKILVENPNREIFTMLHIAIAHFNNLYGNGCNWIEDILQAYVDNLPGVKINHIYYTWTQWEQYWKQMNSWRQRFNENVFGGAEYAEGLPQTTPRAIANGLRGQILAPCYPGLHDHIEQWMLDNIQASIATWNSSKA